MKELLIAQNLHITLKKSKAELVKGISFSLEAGHSLVILGQSGSGKTMTCHAMMGLLDPKQLDVSGTLHFDGRDLCKLSRRERQALYGGEIAMIPQNPMTALDPSMRIGAQMMETLMLHEGTRQAKSERQRGVLSALADAGLPDPQRVFSSHPYQLSGGMLQRVMIAMALMSGARLIIADEPTTALDVAHRNETVDTFLRLRKQGAAVLLVTHDFSVAAQMGENLMVMKEGQIVEQGRVEKILHTPRHEYTQALLAASRLSAGKESPSC